MTHSTQEKGQSKGSAILRWYGAIALLLISTQLNSQQTFTNIAGVGADESDIAHAKDGGCSFADYDRDGDLDLLVNTNDNNGSRRSFLLRNDNGIYTDVTSAICSELRSSLTERTAAWGDFNNDGYPDIFVNSSGTFKVIRNDAGTGFTTILDISSMIDGFNTEGAGWLDYDTDGDLDFFVENHNYGVDIFRNNFPSTTPYFTQVTDNSVGAVGAGAGGLGLPQSGSSTGDYGTSTDINGDGYPDILVRRENNGSNTNADVNHYDLFINDGDGTFTANTTIDEDAANGNKGGVISADFDNDGDFDILWTSASSSANRTVIYQNTGTNSMVFALVANPFVLDGGGAENGNNFDGCAVGDIDNDGDLDVFLTQGSGTSKLFLNNSTGPGNFAFRQPGPISVPGAAINYGINLNGDGEGCVFVDFDNDGDEDLYINKNGAANQLWRNNYIGSAAETAALYQNNYLRVIPLVDLGGGVSRPAINATVRFLDCDGNNYGGIREIGGGGAGHGSQTSPWLIYGLPDGPDASYIIEVQFTRNGTTPVIIQKSVVPSQLPDLNLGSSTLIHRQTLVLMDSEGSDLFYCQDSDGDGINDHADLDNDNDGIPDSEEGCTNLVFNSSFESQDFSDATEFPGGFTEAAGTFIGATYNTNQLDGWTYTTNVDGWVAGQSPSWSSDTFNAAKDGNQYLDVTGNNNVTGGVNNTLSQAIPTTPGQSYTLSFYWGEDVGHAVGKQVTLDVTVEDDIGGTLSSENLVTIASGPASGFRGPKSWLYHETGFIATTDTSIISFSATPPSGSTSAGAALDLVRVLSTQCADTDGDGVEDYLDLDSDNDGIFDLVEAGHGATDANNDGIIDGAPATFGTNGLFDGIEDAPDSGILTQPTADTDEDGIYDSVESDSDNDGCPDVLEAGFTDADEDGEVDGTGYAANGTVTMSDGYTGTDPIVTDFTYVALSCDTDGDGINPIVDLDDDNDGIYDDDECGPTLVNGGFELTTGVNNGNNFVGSVAPWALVSGSHNVIHVDGAGPYVYGNGGPEFDARGGAGNYYDVNSSAGILYQTFTVSVTSTILYEGYFSPRDGNVGTGHIEIRQGTGAGGALISSSDTVSTNDNTTWAYLFKVVVLTPGTYSYLAVLSDPVNFDEARIRGLTCVTDSDGDGVRDSYDLDSDNDGIFDVIEGGSGALDTNGDGVINAADTGFSDTDQDGMDDDSAVISPIDSDGDGNIDSIELDSDNDGCNDIIEAGYSDPDGNGILGDD